MQIKFLKEVVGIVIGNNAENLVDLLYKKNNVSEFLIAKKLDLTVNQTRNILYKLSDQGLVNSTRKKDKRKGWYTYFWSIDVLKSLIYYRDVLQRRRFEFEHQIKSRVSKVFYFCDKCQVEYNEENALLHNFTCPECGDVFVVKDNTKSLKDMGKSSDSLEKELNLLKKEIELEEDKAQKKRDKAHKKVLQEKADIRKKAAEKRKKEAAANKLVKKEVGKKAITQTPRETLKGKAITQGRVNSKRNLASTHREALKTKKKVAKKSPKKNNSKKSKK